MNASKSILDTPIETKVVISNSEPLHVVIPSLEAKITDSVPLPVIQNTPPWDVKVSEIVPVSATITNTVPVSITAPDVLNVHVVDAEQAFLVSQSSFPWEVRLTDATTTLGVTQATGPFDVRLTSSSTTLPVSIGSNVGVTQSTTPWDVKVSSSAAIPISGTVPVTQSTTPWDVKVSSIVPVSANITGSSATLPVSVAAAVPVTQSTTPWDVKLSSSSTTLPVSIASNVGVTQSTTPWDVKVSSSVPVDTKITASSITLPVSVAAAVPVTQSTTPWDVKLSSSSTTLPVSIASNVGVTQSTTPWDVKVSSIVPVSANITGSSATLPVSVAAAVPVTQSTTPWDVKLSSSSTTLPVSIASNVGVTQSTTPWDVKVSSIVPVSANITGSSATLPVSVAAAVPVTQSTTPWDVKVSSSVALPISGNVPVLQATSPWDVKVSSSATLPVSIAAAVPVTQSTTPWDVSVSSSVPMSVNVLNSSSLDTSARSMFGETLTVESLPVAQSSFLYNKINSQQFLTFLGANSSITTGSGLATLSCGNGASYAIIRSRRSVRYRPGQGAELRFTSIFGTGNSAYYKLAGMGTLTNGLYFGFNGLNFGIMRFSNGVQHIVSLTITGAATGAGNATITLNGVSTLVPLTNATGNANFTAYQIAKGTYPGWSSVENIANVVYFIADLPGPLSGTYTFSSAAGGSATFATAITGVAATITFTPQASWNVDAMDGKGTSGQLLDVTKGNVYRIGYQHLGFGLLRFEIENSSTGKFQTVHQIQYSNNNVIPSLFIPHLSPIFLVYNNTSANTSTSMQGCCFAGFIQGPIRRLDPRASFNFERSISANVETPIFVLKNRLFYANYLNQSEVIIQYLGLATDGGKNTIFNLYLTTQSSTIGANTVAGFTDYRSINNDESLLLSDTNSSTWSNAIAVFSCVCAKSEGREIDLTPYNIHISRDQGLILTAKSQGASNISAALSWAEDL